MTIPRLVPPLFSRRKDWRLRPVKINWAHCGARNSSVLAVLTMPGLVSAASKGYTHYFHLRSESIQIARAQGVPPCLWATSTTESASWVSLAEAPASWATWRVAICAHGAVAAALPSKTECALAKLKPTETFCTWRSAEDCLSIVYRSSVSSAACCQPLGHDGMVLGEIMGMPMHMAVVGREAVFR